jgi:hypothetical protein
LKTRRPEDLWEHTAYVPEDMEDEFRDTIIKKIKLQDSEIHQAAAHRLPRSSYTHPRRLIH